MKQPSNDLPSLPICVFRGAVSADRCVCNSPRIVSLTVSLRACTGEAFKKPDCPYRVEKNEQDIGKDQKETTDNRIRGLGDVVAKITAATGIDRVVKAVERATGKPCGCSERRKRLNQLVPFGDSQDADD